MGSHKLHEAVGMSLSYSNPFIAGAHPTNSNHTFSSERSSSGRSEYFHVADDYSDDQYSAFENTRDYDDAFSTTSSRNRFHDAGLLFEFPMHGRTDHDDGDSRNITNSNSYDSFFEKMHMKNPKQQAADGSYCDSNDDQMLEGIDSILFEVPRRPLYDASEGWTLPYVEKQQQPEECSFPLTKWQRKNEVELHEKQAKERERLLEIMAMADDYKSKFYAKLNSDREATKRKNREKQKELLQDFENSKVANVNHYWKAVAALLPNETLKHEEKSNNSEDKYRANYPPAVNMDPQPGKRTDLSRMHQILMKLKNHAPDHLQSIKQSGKSICF